MIERRTVEDRRSELRESASRRAADSGFTRRLEVTKCHQCNRVLCENTRDALRPGEMVAIKCGRCNTMNYMLGQRVDDVA